MELLHTLHVVLRTFLNITEERVISRQFLHMWPPRSPDLKPCDFWLWGHLRQLLQCRFHRIDGVWAGIIMQENNAIGQHAWQFQLDGSSKVVLSGLIMLGIEGGSLFQ
ncbi:hypothetical protein TNCV_1382411 [Trichonephila clavipes]|nr:hypothetical protein TNCV_1382411 [Trichonephila clavipes]